MCCDRGTVPFFGQIISVCTFLRPNTCYNRGTVPFSGQSISVCTFFAPKHVLQQGNCTFFWQFFHFVPFFWTKYFSLTALQQSHSVPKYSDNLCNNILIQTVLTFWDMVCMSKYPSQLEKMSFDEILGLTADFLFCFIILKSKLFLTYCTCKTTMR